MSHFLAPRPTPPRAAAAAAAPPRFPLRKLISHKAWKHWLLGFWAIAAGGMLLWIAARSAAGGETAGRHFLRMFDPVEGRVLPFYQSVLLAIGGQLALLIGWARSRSQEDFHGRYRMWAWCAGGCFAAACTILTDAHLALGETVATLWKLPHPQAPLLAWLIPLCAVGLIVFRGVRAEMAENRAGLALLHLAGLCGLIAAADRLGWLTAGVDRLQAEWRAPLAPIVAHPLFAHGALAAAAAFLMTAMLLHARHVIHVSPEPPAARRSPLQRVFGAIFRRRPAAEADEASGESPSGSKAKSVPAAERSAKTARAKPLIQAAPKDAPAKSDRAGDSEASARDRQPRRSLWGRLFGRRNAEANAPDETSAVEPASRAAKAAETSGAAAGDSRAATPVAARTEPTSSQWDDEDDADDEYESRASRRAGKNSRIDRPAPDPQLLKGLSKRERRQVRKQLREQQRGADGSEEE